MSEEREQAGAPVEQTGPTEDQVLAAVERAGEVDAAEVAQAAETTILDEVDQAAEAAPASRPHIAEIFEPPSAGPTEPVATVAAPAEAVAATLPPERDGEIRVSADHPMAALYMQTPMPPETRGNRGAGFLISLLATIVFALVYAGFIALWQAPNYPPSTFVEQGLLPWVLNPGFVAAVAGFFVALVLLVLIFGKSGWWAYVLGGLLAAALVWAAAVLGFALADHLDGDKVVWQPLSLIRSYGLFLPVLIAGLVAREVTVWFGAWIGARGRKVKQQNAEAIAEYEAALAEVQAKQP